ncbi:MAG: cyclic nucleotide-binding domain-containing protein [Candidatus Celaenobacter antarcticus]|nr:cyclic nucleotide-binding domain-containing protein [Candidatus Celaenobacter antarcticus]MDP8315199.1 cyclic nucleotide-binding domain-containing protein [Candidatus Celaenobacter antarcticus]
MKFPLTITVILQNLYYIGTAIGFIIKEMFWLRVVLIVAGLCMTARGIILQDYVIVFWMSLFAVINLIQVIRILLEKKEVHIDAGILDLYKKIFIEMKTREFMVFWKMGEEKRLHKGQFVCHDGVQADGVIQIIDGDAVVKKNDKVIAHLSRGYFVAEMQYLMDEKPSADVIAETDMRLIVWKNSKLKRLKEAYPHLYNKFHLILSKDLTFKLKRYL